MNDPFELPSLQEIEEMDKQRLQALESLEISDGLVKCQKCGNAVPILRTTTKPCTCLQQQIIYDLVYLVKISKEEVYLSFSIV